ncbi:TetR/AcrR family transcriptional regulator [Mycolicibacterium canariasense]|nr:TetR/AcrR family transcriptional regulator [Mycolicibacterium canariasense]MCV7211693.1 TetR/AcrR family transcriptional regulator [Mycolicibacterium canariasense]ORV08222.1 transcriptional regulator [Mycolicibacterium canariasense]
MKRAEVVRDYGGISAADRRADRRRKLISAGRQIWGESGIADVTVRGVCSAAGLITRYFYEQFDSRDALLFAVVDEVRTQLLDAMVLAGVGESGDLRDKLRAALTAFLDIVADDPHLHRIIVGDVTGVPGLLEYRMQFLDMIVASIIEQAPSVLGSALPDAMAMRRGALFMVGGVNQIIAEWLREPRETVGELAALCADLCVAVVRDTVER